MDATLLAESRSRLGQIRDDEIDLAELHGYRQDPTSRSETDRLDPTTGQRVKLGLAVSVIRRAVQDAAMMEGRRVRGAGAVGEAVVASAGDLLARDERGDRHDEAAEEGAEGAAQAAGGQHGALSTAGTPDGRCGR